MLYFPGTVLGEYEEGFYYYDRPKENVLLDKCTDVL